MITLVKNKNLDFNKFFIYEVKRFSGSLNVVILKKKQNRYTYIDSSNIPYSLDESVYKEYLKNAVQKSLDLPEECKLYQCDNEKDIDSFKLCKELLK